MSVSVKKISIQQLEMDESKNIKGRAKFGCSRTLCTLYTKTLSHYFIKLSNKLTHICRIESGSRKNLIFHIWRIQDGVGRT